jgi:hypothetical protein
MALFGGSIDLDFLCELLRFRRLGQHHSEYALFEARLHLINIDALRNAEVSFKRAKTAFIADVNPSSFPLSLFSSFFRP